MDLRLSEMLDRRKRLIKYTLKKEGRITTNEDFEYFYNDIITKKQNVVSRFSSA